MPVQFSYASDVHVRFPQLRTRAITVSGIDNISRLPTLHSVFLSRANKRLDETTEANFAEVQAWRHVFSAMGFRPTQYRCASEALLRRYRKSRELPSIHPLVDLCNAASLAFAIPVAVFDIEKIQGTLYVKHADGSEIYEDFNGVVENPVIGEIIFVDEGGRAHARRWTHRQSGWSAVQDGTKEVLIVAEALHELADVHVLSLISALSEAICSTWPDSGTHQAVNIMMSEFILLSLIISASPGPGALYTIVTGLQIGRRASLIAALGCVLGIIPHMLAAISGLAALLSANDNLLQILKFIGATYMFYLAWATLKSDAMPIKNKPHQNNWQIVYSAIAINALNPKLSLFFFAFLPQFVKPGEESPIKAMLILSSSFMAITYLVFAIYGVTAAQTRSYLFSSTQLVRVAKYFIAIAFACLALQLLLADN